MKVIVVMSLAMMVNICWSITPTLKCADTARGRLMKTGSCNLKKSGLLLCEPPDITPELDFYQLTFKILEKIPESNLFSPIVKYCVGLKSVHRFNYIRDLNYVLWQDVDFDPDMAVGTMDVQEECLRTQRSTKCVVNATILEDITELGILKFRPEFESFWDFKSPLFKIEMDWFQNMTVCVRQDEEGLIQAKWIPSLQNSSIKVLNIPCMKCQETESALLKEMPNIKEIYITAACIASFHKDSFIGTPKLQTLALQETKFSRIPNVIKRIPYLRSLDLSWNERIFSISMDVLSNLQHLESLNLSYTMIHSIDEKFPKLTHLTELNLKSCGLTSFGKDVFENLPQLEVLILTNNSLVHLYDESFHSLRNLKELHLSQNNFMEWPIIYNVSMEVLDLSNNNLSTIKNLGDFGTRIKNLIISYNNISDWNDINIFKYKPLYTITSNLYPLSEGIRKRCELLEERNSKLVNNDCLNVMPYITVWVQNIDLTYNAITCLSKDMGDSFSGVQSLKLEGNPFDCSDCRIPEFQKWLNKTDTPVEKPAELKCSTPFSVNNMPIVDVEFDEEPCLELKLSLWLVVGTPLGAVLSVCLATTTIIYYFRSDIAYMMHLYRIRKASSTSSAAQYNNCLFDAFVCYSHKNRSFVLNSLVPYLEKCPERYKLCLHERDFPLGSMIVENIVESIYKSRRTIMVISEHFIKSKWCLWELDMANNKMFDDNKNFLIIIQVEPLQREEVPRHLKFYMDTRTFLEWPQDVSERRLEDIILSLKMALGESIFQTTNDQAPLFSDFVNT